MPFKKYQSLTGVSTRNKRLSTRPHGRRWTPRATLWPFWTPRGLLDSTPGTGTWRVSRARLHAIVIVVCWRRQQLVFLLLGWGPCGGTAGGGGNNRQGEER